VMALYRHPPAPRLLPTATYHHLANARSTGLARPLS
jgi:hypothetical protein